MKVDGVMRPNAQNFYRSAGEFWILNSHSKSSLSEE
jgi:hypothetical protein